MNRHIRWKFVAAGVAATVAGAVAQSRSSGPSPTDVRAAQPKAVGYAGPQPIRWLAEGRDPSATLDSAKAGFGKNDGDNQITGVHVSDGDPSTRGILGAKIPGFGHDGWRWFWSQQHGDNGLGDAPRIPQPPGRRLVAAAEGGLATTLERTPCRAPVMK